MMMIFNMLTSYSHKFSFPYFEDYLMTKLTLGLVCCPCTSFFLSARAILSSISSLWVGYFLILPIKMKYLIVWRFGSMLAHGPIKPNHLSLLPFFFLVNVRLVVRLKLNFILVKASIHPGQSKLNHISLMPLALAKWMSVVHVTRFKLNFILFFKSLNSSKILFSSHQTGVSHS
jgi:hypothetical protein